MGDADCKSKNEKCRYRVQLFQSLSPPQPANMPTLPPARPGLRLFANGLYAGRWWWLALAVGLFLLARPWAAGLQMDRRIDQMFPTADASVDAYHYLTEHFGGNAIVLMVYADDELFSEAGIARAEQLGQRVREVPGVRASVSISDVSTALENLRALSLFAGQRGPALLEASEATTAFRQLFAGYTHNQEGDHGAIVAMLEPSGARGSYQPTIAELRRIAGDLPAPLQDAVLVGQPVLVTEGFSLIAEDGQRLSTTTVWLLSAVLLILFRTGRWVLVALLVIYWSSTVTRGVAVWAGMQLSLVSSMLTAILTVVAVAAIIHVAMGWIARRRRGDDLRAASEKTITRLAPPIFWACVTDAVGFAALLSSEVGPVRDFGLMMTLGVGVVLLGLSLLLPAVMSLPLGSTQRFSLAQRFDRRLQRAAVRATAGLLASRRIVLTLLALISTGTLIGLTWLTAETNFLRNFRESSPITTAYRLVENRFGGAGTWDVLVPAPSQSIDNRYLESVRTLETRLKEIRVEGYPKARVAHTLSIADVDAAAARSANPLIRLASPDIRLTRMRGVMPSFTRALLMPPSATQPRYLRIMLRSPEDLSTAAKTELIAAVEREVQQHTRSEAWRTMLPQDSATDAGGQVTGYYVLLARLVDSLLGDQWTCLALAATAVFAILLLATGNFKSALLAMIPNLLPVLATLSLLGWLGLPLNMGGAMIAAVSIGLTIDGSIHFLASYHRSRQRYGRPAGDAVLRAQSRVGMAIILSTIALVAGFSVLTSSSFVPTATFGWLLSAAMLLGMLANLILMPVLLAK